jgi:DNA polymerase III subunit beta
MQFITSKENLLNGLKNVIGIASDRSTMPVLSMALLDCSGSKLNIYGTNLDLSINSMIDVEMKEEGKLCINANRLNAIVKELKNVPIVVSTKDNNLILESDKGKYSLLGLPAEEFPAMPTIDNKDEVEVDYNVLRDIFRRTVFCVNQNDTRIQLTGLNVAIKDKKMVICGTNGHKLSKVDREISAEKSYNIIVSKDTIEAFMKMSDGNKIFLSDNFVVFRTGNTTLYSRLLEGPYPNYEQILPQNNDKVMTIDRDGLVTALKRIMVFTGRDGLVKFDIKPGMLEVSTVNRELLSEGTETLKSECDFEMTIGFNAFYLSEIINVFGGDNIIFKFLDALCAVLVYPSKDNEVEKWFTLIMPCLLDK